MSKFIAGAHKGQRVVSDQLPADWKAIMSAKPHNRKKIEADITKVEKHEARVQKAGFVNPPVGTVSTMVKTIKKFFPECVTKDVSDGMYAIEKAASPYVPIDYSPTLPMFTRSASL